MRSYGLLIMALLAVSPAIAQTDPGASQQGTPQQNEPPGSNQTNQPPQSAPPLKTTVTVNATLASEVPASITVLTGEQLEQIPGANLDDRLRQVPGFSLFRRSSSMVANPTTQGVSLRAIGSSGASRTLVLWDGIPINDPFGGWVYWDRIDPDYISEVDITRGASTSIFGDRAMGGTISLFSPLEQHQQLQVDVLTGNESTEDVSAGYSNLWGLWGLSVHSRALETNGYYITPEPVRGSVDDLANVRFATGDARIDYLGVANRLSLHFDILAEERHNGTLLTHNSTGLGMLALTYTHSWSNDQISFLGYHSQEQFNSTYSQVSANRDHETLASNQRVPVQDSGGLLYWQHHARRWNTIAGADADDTHGISYDYSYLTHLTTPSGGTLLKHGVFGQADLTWGPARFFAGIRHEFTGQHGETFVSPNSGVAVGLKNFRLRASGYESFRAPTLNELYRPFRVGNTQTLANADLIPEGLVGVEAGADWNAENTSISFTLFHNQLNNFIDNATLLTTPNFILRQRENFPSGFSRGVEANIAHHWSHWTAQAGYVYANALLASGLRIPEVPKNQGTAQISFNAKNTIFSGGIRAFSLVFDDDLNQFLLPGYSTIQFSAQQRLTGKLSAVASVNNLLNHTYLVALTPSPNTGAPLLWQVGLRWNGSIK